MRRRKRKMRVNPIIRVNCMLDWMKQVGIDFKKNQEKIKL